MRHYVHIIQSEITGLSWHLYTHGDWVPWARHQTAHLLTGFIGLPGRQLNALANSGKFITDAFALRQNETKVVHRRPI